jgi:hypothetical protein
LLVKSAFFAAFIGYGLLFTAAVRAQPAPAELRVIDSEGQRLAGANLQASLSRTLPEELGTLPGPDRDALRFLLIGPPDSSLEALEVLTFSAQGRPLDVIVNFRAEPVTCPDGVAPEQVCRQTLPLRLVADALERNHPALKARSLRAEVGGSVRVALAGRRLLELAVAGPRRAHGSPLGRLRARLRVLVLRGRAGGAPAVGGTDAGARRLLEQELASTAGLWGQCGLELGATAKTSIELVDPPKTQLLAVGCGMGQPASGGIVRVQTGRKTVALETHAGESPVSVALRLAQALGAGGKPPHVFENQRAYGDAMASADVLLDGARRWQRSVAGPLSNDPTLPVCLGEVDLNDGVTHFGDNDAFVGTLEERTLLRSFDDGDPRSVEVLVVPELDGGRRIGESFIVSPGSSLSNTVIIDRSAIEAGARSFALAHELGHVLLAMPGHPDDFGVDQSWSLMDADVADGSIFGPRRLSLADCERMVTQTGPASLTPLLEAIPAP